MIKNSINKAFRPKAYFDSNPDGNTTLGSIGKRNFANNELGDMDSLIIDGAVRIARETFAINELFCALSISVWRIHLSGNTLKANYLAKTYNDKVPPQKLHHSPSHMGAWIFDKYITHNDLANNLGNINGVERKKLGKIRESAGAPFKVTDFNEIYKDQIISIKNSLFPLTGSRGKG